MVRPGSCYRDIKCCSNFTLGGYRWLKYVPNGILKTAQAAEWKVQAWMIGKPPKITYEGIGYNAKAPVSSATYNIDSSGHFVRARSRTNPFDDEPQRDETEDFSSHVEIKRTKSRTSAKSSPYATDRPSTARPSVSGGSTFSDYDDLADFTGRFDSRATFERLRTEAGTVSPDTNAGSEQTVGPPTKKRPSRGFLRIWKGLPNNNSGPVPPVPPIEPILRQLPTQTPTTPQPSNSPSAYR